MSKVWVDCGKIEDYGRYKVCLFFIFVIGGLLKCVRRFVVEWFWERDGEF